MFKLNKPVFSAFRLCIMSLLALTMFCGSAAAQQWNQSDLNEIIKGQPPFTENELNLFIADYPKIQSMEEEEITKYLAEQGLTTQRFLYIFMKVQICYELLKYEDLQNEIDQLPQELRPQKDELELTKKNEDKIAEL